MITTEEQEIVEKAFEILVRESYGTAKEKGWWETIDNLEESDLKEMVRGLVFSQKKALCDDELSEVHEEFRNHGLDPEKFIYLGEKGKPEGIAVEFADLFVRSFDMFGYFKIPIVKALLMKMEYNRTRPYRHGGKKA